MRKILTWYRALSESITCAGIDAVTASPYAVQVNSSDMKSQWLVSYDPG